MRAFLAALSFSFATLAWAMPAKFQWNRNGETYVCKKSGLSNSACTCAISIRGGLYGYQIIYKNDVIYERGWDQSTGWSIKLGAYEACAEEVESLKTCN